MTKKHTKNSQQKATSLKNFNTPEVHCVHERLTSDAQIQKFGSQNKYKVEQHRGSKVQEIRERHTNK